MLFFSTDYSLSQLTNIACYMPVLTLVYCAVIGNNSFTVTNRQTSHFKKEEGKNYDD